MKSNSKNSVTLLILLDAFRYDYLGRNRKLFFNILKQSGIIGRIFPTFGFEPDAAYIAGLYPDEANGGAQFWLDPDGSQFSFIGSWSRVFNWLPQLPERGLRRLLKHIVKRNNSSPTLSTAGLPFHLLKYFGLPMKCRMDEPGFAQTDTVFDILKKAGKSCLYHGPPNCKVDIESVVQRVKKALYPPVEFVFLHIGALDHIGHEFGPDSEEIEKALRRVDNGVRQVFEMAQERYESVHLMLFGDHGMIRVERIVDVWSGLKQLPIKMEKDYFVFLDSTMARFWFLNDRAEELIIGMLNGLKGGHILNMEEKDRYHLNYSHNKFGDINFLVDPGVLIFPNFYQNKKPVKGMHGYAPETPEQQSAFLVHSPRIRSSKVIERLIDMRRIFPTILDLLHLPIPQKITVTSLIT